MASVEAPASVTPAGPMTASGGATAPSPEARVSRAATTESFRSARSALSAPSTLPDGALLTGKQEHYLKRELISREVHDEISELSSPTALQRFGAPFRSPYGEVSPVDSELPILRYIFVNHVRNFPFLDRAKEKEFWQDKLQVFLESFAGKYISSSEDRLEETKRRKLSKKCEKLVELMMVSGVPTASGYEERIRFEEMEVVDRGANEQGLVVNQPDGHFINGWDINVAAVRMVSVKRTVRYHQHAEFLIRVRRPNKDEYYIGRRYGDFVRLQKRLRLEMPGKVLIPLPKKNMSHSLRSLLQPGVSSRLKANGSLSASSSPGGRKSPQPSLSSERDPSPRPVRLHREDQRVSLRAFLRTVLQNQQVAESKAMADFLTDNAIELNEEEMDDVGRRREMDERRLEEQRQFYEIARKRAAELDIYMERFRREIVEHNGLTSLFAEIKQKNTIQELSPKYKKFAEWLRIEVAATLYHLFLAEDNSPELFAQFKRIHSLIPYTILKNVIRVANPAAVMAGVLDLFLAQPFGARSLLQRIFSQAIHDGMRQIKRAIDDLTAKINDPVLTDKLKAFVDCSEETKNVIRAEAGEEQVDIVVGILRSEHLSPELTSPQIERVFNAFAAWNAAVESPDAELRQGAEMFSQLKQQLKLLTRFRDKAMMAQMIEEANTLRLFRDLFTIFYEPLVRVYKSANVYGSITDFAVFATDAIKTIEIAQRQDVSADPNQTVQSFIDLCARHEDNLYKFIHEVHLHDNGLFGALMSWIEGILDFLRTGPKAGKLDMNAIFHGGLDQGLIDAEVARAEINDLIRWHEARKKWHSDKTRQKMAQDDSGPDHLPGANTFKSGDFGLDQSAGGGEKHRTDSEPVQVNRLSLRFPRS
ncbi:hypothetical protein DV737_g3796, partial [Chaetothyriales sp. CBS 132003]